jgi:hypothetical protein
MRNISIEIIPNALVDLLVFGMTCENVKSLRIIEIFDLIIIAMTMILYEHFYDIDYEH